MTTAPRSILIVDDDPLNRRLMLRMLAGAGFELEEAASGAAAVAMAMNKRYDYIFLDISMPAISGITVARSIRRHYGADAPRLIACTAHQNFGSGSDEDTIAQFDAIMTKPFIKSDLLRMLNAGA